MSAPGDRATRGSMPQRAPRRVAGFQPGHAKVGGRKKGSVNRITADVLEDIYGGLAAAGFDDKGEGGVLGFVKKLAINHPEKAATLLIALVPSQLKLESRVHRIDESRTVLDLRQDMIAKGVPEQLVNLLEAPPPIENEYDGENGAVDTSDDDAPGTTH